MSQRSRISTAIRSGMTTLDARLPPEAELVPLTQETWVSEGGSSYISTRLCSPIEGLQFFHQALCLNVDAHSIAYEVIKKDDTSLG